MSEEGNNSIISSSYPSAHLIASVINDTQAGPPERDKRNGRFLPAWEEGRGSETPICANKSLNCLSDDITAVPGGHGPTSIKPISK